jgi:ferredoxin
MTLHVEIDEHACLAHGDCAAVAPGVFAVNDIAEVIGTGPDALLREAARACPAGAIVLIDADTGEEVEP